MPKSRKVTPATQRRLYAAARYLDLKVEKELGLRIHLDVYLQDPLIEKENPQHGFDEGFSVQWEPSIADGPTSARFAVVDYNGDTGQIAPMAKWDEKKGCFIDSFGKVVNKNNSDSLQFHQVNIWAILQSAIDFFEDGRCLGRRIPFGFDGNRLIVVPHAGYGQNAFYDRASKSIQFYYFDSEDSRVYTCLSTDIINHEFGHAVLDGIRPYLIKSTLLQTGAFHEFIGDLAALLVLFRNNKFRRWLADETKGDLAQATHLADIAEQFGKVVTERPYLRSASNQLKMSDMAESVGPHHLSQVLTGAMFDILLRFSNLYFENPNTTAKEAYWYAADRIRRVAFQPLDLLPPVDVTFKDYAIAVLHMEKLSNPADPKGYYDMMLKVFRDRGILNEKDENRINNSDGIFEYPNLRIYQDISDISQSRTAAYHFLDANREAFLIPSNQDLRVVDLYESNKLTRKARRLPRQIIIQYMWHEQLKLDGPQFHEHNGELTTLLCGATLVFDEHNNLLSWFRKPGTSGGDSVKWQAEKALGELRKKELLDNLAKLISARQVGTILESNRGMLKAHIPHMNVQKQNGTLSFERSPHLNILGDDHQHNRGREKWEISS